MIEQLHTIKLPKTGLWRVGRKQDPLAFIQPEPPTLNGETHPRHRFDDLLGRIGVAYFSATAEGAIVETAMPMRAKSALSDLLPDDDTIGPRAVSRAYRENRLLVQAGLEPTDDRPTIAFVDLEDAANLSLLYALFEETFKPLGLDQLTLGEVHGRDRTITAAIASTIIHASDSSGIPLFAGARYFSKYGVDYENFVIFAGVKPVLLEARPIELTDPDLQAAATRLKLRFH